MQPRLPLGALAFCALANLASCKTEPPAPPPAPPSSSPGGPESSSPPSPLALASGPLSEGPDAQQPDKTGLAPAVKPPLPPRRAEQAPPPSPRAADLKAADLLRGRVETYFQGHVGRRIHIQTDKPLYKPGETVWVKLWDMKARSLDGDHGGSGINLELVSPRGAVVLKRRVREQHGSAQADLPILNVMAGGEYTLRARTFDGHTAERPVIVSSYEAPRLQLKLEFLRKAYGAGDEVTATIAVRRATGEPLRSHALTGLVRLDGQDLPKVSLRTDDSGEGLVRFQLPERIDTGDGLLTVLADDGGLTESVAKRVPIIVNKLSFQTFAEGGQLVDGLPGRVYFEAKNPLGKPADVAGRVVDERGEVVANFVSVRDGLGRFDLTPGVGRQYHIEIDRPAGIAERYPLEMALAAGCSLRSFDDLDGELSDLRVAVSCSQARRVLVSAMLRENLLDAAVVDVPASAPAIVYLQPTGAAAALGRSQGVARVTVWDEKLDPLAERLVYRNRRARLGIQVEPEKKGYSPREQVALGVTTTDATGQPVAAEVGLSVVDDTVLTFADDKTGHMLSRLYLEPEIPGKVEEPNFYFDLSEEKSALGMDLLMGTRGWRKFEWQPVVHPVEHRTRGPVATARPAPPPAPVQQFGGLARRKGEAAEQEEAQAAPALPEAATPPAENKPMELAAPADRPMERDKDNREAARERAKEAGVLKALQAPMAAAPRPELPAGKAAPAATRAAAPMHHEGHEGKNAALEPRAPAKADDAKAEATPAPRHAAPPPAMGALAGLRGEGRGGGGRGEAILGIGEAGGNEKKALKQPAPPMKAKRMMDLNDPLGDPLMGLGDIEGPGHWRRPALALPRPRPAVEWSPVRVFPVPAYKPDYDGPRTDFRETLLFAPSVKTDKDGKATVRFFLSDAITSFRVVAEGIGAGAAGRGEAVVKSSLPFSMGVKAPVEVSEGDHLDLPLQLVNERERPLQVDLSAEFGALLRLDRPVARTQVALGAGQREALFYPITVTGKKGKSRLHFAASASGLRDEFERDLVVVPRGFPQHVARSGQVRDRAVAELDLGVMLAGTADGKLRLYPSPVASMISGLEGMLQEPSGCFEQASSTNYPNVMILRYLKQQHHVDAALQGKTSQLLDVGYKRLAGYETPRRGYEWFGAAPGHEALTAYGLMQFTDMKEVYGDVDREMLHRTAEWLRARRDGKGGYQRDGKALDSFGRASKEVTDAYITYSLTEAHQTGLEPELAVAERTARESGDAYLLALSTNSLFNAGRKDAGQAAALRLLGLQDGSGGFLKEDHSITRSGGDSLHIETTALAVLALLKADGQEEAVRKGVEWLGGHRGGYGQWGATQSTVLALKALTAYALASRRTLSPGDVTLQVNGQVVAREHYEAGRRAPIVFSDLERHLRQGKNHVEIIHDGKAPLPYSLGIDYRALKPASSSQAVVELATALERDRVGLGQSVRMNVTVRNRTGSGQPMTLVRVGLPGGLSFQTWQLKELRDKGLIAFYETGPREVNLYLREMQPHQEVRLPLDLLATVPGTYTGPASRAYLYYTSEHKTWTDGVQVTITP